MRFLDAFVLLLAGVGLTTLMVIAQVTYVAICKKGLQVNIHFGPEDEEEDDGGDDDEMEPSWGPIVGSRWGGD